MKEREKNPLLHHKVREFDTQKKVFEQLTVASTVLSDPQTAFQEIDRVLHAALRYKRPVYIELPRDMVSRARHPAPPARRRSTSAATRAALRAALAEAVADDQRARASRSSSPTSRCTASACRTNCSSWRSKTNIPVAATMLGKSVIGEQHPLYLGVYEGAMGRDDVRRYVERAIACILLGAFMTDINLGIYTARLDPARSIYATSEKLSIRYHTTRTCASRISCAACCARNCAGASSAAIPRPRAARRRLHSPRRRKRAHRPAAVRAAERVPVATDTVVVADVGDALFGAADLFIHERTEFLSPAYYTSMGFAVPASIGAQLANPKLRPLVLVGDGAFQMTGMELATVARYGLNPIVVVLNNGGYGTERHMQDGPYNDVWPWQYHRLPEMLGAGRGFVVETEDELDRRLARSGDVGPKSFCIARGAARPARPLAGAGPAGGADWRSGL